MKRKELAKFIDQMSDCLESVDFEARVHPIDPSVKGKTLRKAGLTSEELFCVKAGAIAALIDVYGLLTGEIEPEGPGAHAIEMMVKTIGLLVEDRASSALKGSEAND